MERIELAVTLMAALITEPFWNEESEGTYRAVTPDVDEDLVPYEKRLAIASRRLLEAMEEELASPTVFVTPPPSPEVVNAFNSVRPTEVEMKPVGVLLDGQEEASTGESSVVLMALPWGAVR